jgi:arabinogalactan oligomer/maltooligosaccharide transport system substrate-binding protein
MASTWWMRATGVVLAAAVALAARADDLVVWDSFLFGEKVGWDKVVAAYNAKKGAAGPRVVTVKVPFDGMADRVAAAVPRGKGPDVFIFPQDRLGGWVEAGNIVAPIDAFIDAATRARFIPATLDAMTYRGSVYGLPTSYKTLILFYNKALVRQPPRTTAELAALAAKLTDRQAGVYGFAYLYNDYYYHAALQNGFGGGPFDKRGQPVLDSPENVRAMKLLLDWKRELLPEEEPSRPFINALFNEGKAAMLLEGPWFRGEISSAVAYGLAPLPTLSEAGGRPMRPWMTVEGAYIAAPSRQKAAAYDFLSYLTDVEAAKIMALEGAQMPANQRVYLDPALASNEQITAFFKQARTAVAMPNLAEMTVMWPKAFTALGSILRGSATPEAALAKAQAELVKGVDALRGPARPPTR